MHNVLTIVMAGGEGTRLSVLVNRRAKPAVPFGGIYRIIDFPMSNVMHSGGRYVGIITQYRPYSLADHIGQGEWWGLFGFDRKTKVLSPIKGDKDSDFYHGTADAIYHNIEFIDRFPHTTEVLILSADHIYKMDYRKMLALHRERHADLTIATQEVPWEDTSRFGIMVCDPSGRITQFQEKPKINPLSNKASLGIYIFNKKFLIDQLRYDQTLSDSSHDFGADIIPRVIKTNNVFNYDFHGYWRDVGTIRAYMEASLELLNPETSSLDLKAWGIRTNQAEIPMTDQHPVIIGPHASVRHSITSKGCRIDGEVEDSILSPGVIIGKGAKIKRCVLLHGVHIGDDCVLEDVIIDKRGVVGNGAKIGLAELGDTPNMIRPDLLNTGTCVIATDTKIDPGIQLGKNCLIYPSVHVHGDTATKVPAGTTFTDSVF